MKEKCFCHFNGYEVKDAAARKIAVTPQMFGAVGDGAADDSIPIQKAFDSGVTVFFPAGRYKFSGIRCNKSVTIEFDNAELVPDYYEGTNGVFKNVFRFTDCDTVTIKGLTVKNNPVAADRTYTHMTESICEFHNCKYVSIEKWDVYGITYHNRGNTPNEIYNRRGVLFTGIDSNVHVCDCNFGRIEHEEWFWVTHQNNLNQSSCIVENCRFYDNENGLSQVGILAKKAKVTGCTFEDLTYTGSLANLLALDAEFSNNIITRCNAESVCDFREGVWIFSDKVICRDNVMIDSTCTKFAPASSKYAYIANNVVRCKQLVYAHSPTEKNIMRNGDVITDSKFYIENNNVECEDFDECDVSNSMIFFGYNIREGLWESTTAEVIVRNNRFHKTTGKNSKNILMMAVDIPKITVENNHLFCGLRASVGGVRHGVINVTASYIEESKVYLLNNIIDGNTISDDSTSANTITATGNLASVIVKAFRNSVLDTIVKPHMCYEYAERFTLEGQANINFHTDANTLNSFVTEISEG